MSAPAIRASRGIRSRIAKRKAMRTPRRLTIDRKGLLFDGIRFPYWVAADVDIKHFANRSIVSVDILTERVEIIEPLNRHARISQTWM